MTSVATVGSIAAGVLGSDHTQCIAVKFAKEVLNLFRLKNAYCIVVNDLHRKNLNFEFDDSKFQLLDVEKAYLALLTDGEVARLSKLKLMNSRAWLAALRKPCKMLYNNVRQHWNKERVVVVVSCKELAKELKIVDKKIMTFVPDEDLLREMLEGLDDQQRRNHGMYITEMIRRHSQHENRVDYKNVAQLKQRLEEWMSSLKA